MQIGICSRRGKFPHHAAKRVLPACRRGPIHVACGVKSDTCNWAFAIPSVSSVCIDERPTKIVYIQIGTGCGYLPKHSPTPQSSARCRPKHVSGTVEGDPAHRLVAVGSNCSAGIRHTAAKIVQVDIGARRGDFPDGPTDPSIWSAMLRRTVHVPSAVERYVRAG